MIRYFLSLNCGLCGVNLSALRLSIIGSLPSGDPGINCFVEDIPKYLMFPVRALKPIAAGGVLHVAAVIPSRYHVRRNRVAK